MTRPWALMIRGLSMAFGRHINIIAACSLALTPYRPDHCDGGFDQFCDRKRQYSNISLILVDSGRGDLLEYMSEYWKDFRGDDENLWQHEWNKHGTCVSTLEPHCYEDYVPQQDVVDYFDRTAEVFKELSTFEVSLVS